MTANPGKKSVKKVAKTKASEKVTKKKDDVKPYNGGKLSIQKEETAGANGIFKVVEIESLVPSKTNPRKTFNHIDELAESIKSNGLINPLTVRTVEDYYEIICGERRYKAALTIGLATVPVIIRELTDDEVLEVQIVENLQRSDVHPLDEAEGFKNLLDSGKYNITALAERIGRSAHYVYNRLQLNKLIEPVRSALADEYITISHAILLANLSDELQNELFAEIDNRNDQWRNHEADSVQDLKSEIQSRMRLMSKAPFDITKDCTNCQKCTGNNAFLFPELNEKKESKCTDEKCWKEKVEEFILNKKQKFEEKNKPVVLITDDYSVSEEEKEKEMLTIYQYKPAVKEKCESTVDAIYTKGDKIGKATKVCTDPNCKIHFPNGAGPGGSGGDKKDPNEVYTRRLELAFEPLELEMINECAKSLITGVWEHPDRPKSFDISFSNSFPVLFFAITHVYALLDYTKRTFLNQLLREVRLISEEKTDNMTEQQEKEFTKFVYDYLDYGFNYGDEGFEILLFQLNRDSTAGLERLLFAMLAISKLHTAKDGCIRNRSQSFYEICNIFFPVDETYKVLCSPYYDKAFKMEKSFAEKNNKVPNAKMGEYHIELKHIWADLPSIPSAEASTLADQDDPSASLDESGEPDVEEGGFGPIDEEEE